MHTLNAQLLLSSHKGCRGKNTVSSNLIGNLHPENESGHRSMWTGRRNFKCYYKFIQVMLSLGIIYCLQWFMYYKIIIYLGRKIAYARKNKKGIHSRCTPLLKFKSNYDVKPLPVNRQSFDFRFHFQFLFIYNFSNLSNYRNKIGWGYAWKVHETGAFRTFFS